MLVGGEFFWWFSGFLWVGGRGWWGGWFGFFWVCFKGGGPLSADLTPLEWSNQLGDAAFATFLDLARSLGPRLVLDAHFQARFGGHADVAALSMKPTQIFCHAPTTVVLRRHHERFDGRHPAHQVHGLPTIDDISAAEPFFSPLDIAGPVRVIDTSLNIDLDGLAAWVLDQAHA